MRASVAPGNAGSNLPPESALRNQKFADSPLERAGFEPSVPGESGFDFAREVRGRLFAGERRIRTLGSSRGMGGQRGRRIDFECVFFCGDREFESRSLRRRVRLTVNPAAAGDTPGLAIMDRTGESKTVVCALDGCKQRASDAVLRQVAGLLVGQQRASSCRGAGKWKRPQISRAFRRSDGYVRRAD